MTSLWRQCHNVNYSANVCVYKLNVIQNYLELLVSAGQLCDPRVVLSERKWLGFCELCNVMTTCHSNITHYGFMSHSQKTRINRRLKLSAGANNVARTATSFCKMTLWHYDVIIIDSANHSNFLTRSKPQAQTTYLSLQTAMTLWCHMKCLQTALFYE